jgi:hypothetical protein
MPMGKIQENLRARCSWELDAGVTEARKVRYVLME